MSVNLFFLSCAMFSGLLFGKNKNPLNGYKVTSIDRNKKCGIAADSLKMLKEKATQKFKVCMHFVPSAASNFGIVVLFSRSKIVNCIWQKMAQKYKMKCISKLLNRKHCLLLPHQKQSLKLVSHETVQIDLKPFYLIQSMNVNFCTDFQLMYECIKKSQTTVFSTADIIRNFVNENRTEFDKFLDDLHTKTHSSNENTLASLRTEHEEWFEGIPLNITTKEEVMARRSQDRIRGYFYKTKEECMKSNIYRTNAKARELLKRILDVFQHFLIGVDHFSSLFNRKWDNRHQIVSQNATDDVDATANAPPRKKRREMIRDALSNSQLKTDFYVSLCDAHGEFRCHGSWNIDACKYAGHRINPYASRENVVLFQVWNLDHQIEITRSVIPSLLADVMRIAEGRAICRKHNKPAKTVSIVKYFLELFTMHNLKLVHIVCHDKGCHSLRSTGTIICVNCKEYKMVERFMRQIK